MNSKVIVGIILVVIGVVALAYQGITYTKREKVIDIGPIQATAEHKKTIDLPPVIGIAGIAAGAVLIFLGSRARAA